jgi:MoxR-like ATPase
VDSEQENSPLAKASLEAVTGEGEQIPKTTRFWIEKTIIRDRPDRQEGPYRLGETLWSPQRSSSGGDIYANMRDLTPGDVVLHLTNNKAVSGVSIVAERADENFRGPPGTDWAGRSCYRVPLRDFQPIDPPLLREWFLGDSQFSEELRAIAQQPRGRGLFYNDKLDLNQGAYLTAIPKQLLAVLDAAYLKHAGRHIPNVPSSASLPGQEGSSPKIDEIRGRESISEEPRRDGRVWVWAPGERAAYWDELYENGIMALGWIEIGDFQKYRTIDDFKQALELAYGGETDQGQNARMCFDFAQTVKPNDIVFVKRGRKTFVGRGIVTGQYRYDSARTNLPSFRTVQWTTRGEWEWPDLLPMKTLTEWKDYPAQLDKLERLMGVSTIGSETTVPAVLAPAEREPYSIEDALQGLFMSRERFERILMVWSNKKNLILQGAPGVGKSFVARRLAYSLMKFRDPTRIRSVQFHQSYSYEDFVQGYRPTGQGFALRDGVFLNFCNKALQDPSETYVFVIDEINRGNLSKILGELMLLIEPDKRSPEWAVKITYAESPDERLYFPPNVFILGMMNTADRSLAVVDYALRRRFSFATLEPAFDQPAFKDYLLSVNVPASLISRIVEKMTSLNEAIAADAANLGRGFCIGHSFFTPVALSEDLDDQWYERVVLAEIVPLIEEYWFDQPDTAKRWREHLLAR